MTTVAVVGGTGLAGSQIVREGARRGLETRVVSRHPHGNEEARLPSVTHVAADVLDAGSLARALEGVDVVIDALNGQGRRGRKTLVTGSHNLLAAAEAAGVQRAVLLSIINVDQSTFGYYRSKAEQERAYAASALETVVVRSTQFHDFVAAMFASGARMGLIPAFTGTSFQSISTADVAKVLLEAASGENGRKHRTITIAGPQVQTMRDLAEQWRRGTGSSGRIVEVPLPGAFGRFLRNGLNLAPELSVGVETFAEWLARNSP